MEKQTENVQIQCIYRENFFIRMTGFTNEKTENIEQEVENTSL